MAPKPDLKAEGKTLAGYLADARKGPIAFAMLDSAGGLVIAADKIKSAQAMRGVAKGLGGGRGCWGEMVFDGRTLTLLVEAEAPGNFGKLAQRHFSDRGHVLRVELQVKGEAREDRPKEKPSAENATGGDADKSGKAAPDDFPDDPANPDDEDDLAAQKGDLKALIAATRKKPYNFACLMADGGVVLQAHRRRPPELLVKKARAAGGGPRGGFGTMRTEGKSVVLTCVEDPPRPLARSLKLHLRERGFFLGVKLVTVGGEVLLEDLPDDDSSLDSPAGRPGPAAGAGAGAAADPAALKGEAETLRRAVQADATAAASPAARKLDGMMALLDEFLLGGNLDKAVKLLDAARKLVAPLNLAASVGAVPPATFGTAPGGKVVWVDGATSGAAIATFGDETVTAGKRIEAGYDSADQATAIARSVGGTAAVLLEAGQYAVYKTSGTSGFFGEVTNIDTVRRGKTDETYYKPSVANLVVLITGDRYVVRIEGGIGKVDRDSALTGPLEGHVLAFGEGLSNITDEDQFLDQMRLAMRDVAYDAVNKAEEAAKEAQEKFSRPVTPEDQEKLTAALDAMKPIDAKLSDANLRLRLAQAALATKIATLSVNPFAFGTSIVGSLGTGTFQPPWAAEQAAMEKVQAEMAQLQAERSAAAKDFPLALRIDDPDDFRKLSPEEQSKRLKTEADGVMEDVKATRENIDDDDFDFWTMPGIANATAAGLGLKDPQLAWARGKTKWEGTKDTVRGVGEAVVGIGLAVGAALASGGLAVALGGGALVVGGASAVNQTEEYFRKGSAANIALDPSAGLIPPEDVPHWGWVAAAWVGVGLDAAGVASAIKAMKAAKTVEEGLIEAARILKIAEGDIDKVLRPALTGKNVSSFTTAMAGETAFAERFGNTASEAATVIRKNPKGGFDIEVVVRAGADPTTRAAAVAEEMRHISQLSDPKFADDVAHLTEEALADWATKGTDDKLKALRSQLRLEEDARRGAVEAIERRMSSAASDAERAVLQAELDEAKAGLDDFGRKLAEVEEGLPSGKVPGWADLDVPPRLFNTPKSEQVTKKALDELPGLQKAWDDLGDEADAYYLAEINGSYQMKHRPGIKVPTRQLVKKGGTWSIEITGERSVEKVREELVQLMQGAHLTPGMAEGMAGFTTPFQRAYAAKFSNAFEALGDSGKVEAILKKLGGLSDSALEGKLRDSLRQAMVAEMKGLEPAEQAEKLKKFMKAMPDNGSRGKLFSDFRKANMGTGLADVVPDVNATTLKGVNRSGDGLVEVSAKGGKPPAKPAKGPKPGRYLAEDKNSADAFKKSQLAEYNRALSSEEGLVMADGKVLDGVTYFFPDVDSADAALRELAKGSFSPKIHVGYYENGAIVWAR